MVWTENSKLTVFLKLTDRPQRFWTFSTDMYKKKTTPKISGDIALSVDLSPLFSSIITESHDNRYALRQATALNHTCMTMPFVYDNLLSIS